MNVDEKVGNMLWKIMTPVHCCLPAKLCHLKSKILVFFAHLCIFGGGWGEGVVAKLD